MSKFVHPLTQTDTIRHWWHSKHQHDREALESGMWAAAQDDGTLIPDDGEDLSVDWLAEQIGEMMLARWASEESYARFLSSVEETDETWEAEDRFRDQVDTHRLGARMAAEWIREIKGTRNLGPRPWE